LAAKKKRPLIDYVKTPRMPRRKYGGVGRPRWELRAGGGGLCRAPLKLVDPGVLKDQRGKRRKKKKKNGRRKRRYERDKNANTDNHLSQSPKSTKPSTKKGERYQRKGAAKARVTA